MAKTTGRARPGSAQAVPTPTRDRIRDDLGFEGNAPAPVAGTQIGLTDIIGADVRICTGDADIKKFRDMPRPGGKGRKSLRACVHGVWAG